MGRNKKMVGGRENNLGLLTRCKLSSLVTGSGESKVTKESRTEKMVGGRENNLGLLTPPKNCQVW